MSKARLLADLLADDGNVESTSLGNLPATDWNTMANKPTLAASATTDTTNSSNITSGDFATTQLGSRSNLGRPSDTPKAIKNRFMKGISDAV